MRKTHASAREGRMRSRAYTLVVLAAVSLVVVAALLLVGCATNSSNDTTAGGQGSNTTQGAVWQDDNSSNTSQTADDQSATTALSTTSSAAVDNPEQSPAEYAAERLAPSVVNVAVEGVINSNFGQQQYAGEGSGVIISSDGKILTNNHVVSQEVSPGQFQNADKLTVTLATGEKLPATIVGTDPLTDLAVISIQKTGLPAAEFIQDPAQVKVGQYAVAIGSPLGYENSVTLGIVSGVYRDLPVSQSTEQFALVDLIQTDAAISPGNSGGALANSEGQVIGINVAYLPPGTGAQNLGFAIPSDVAQSVATQLVQTGKVVHAFMGIQTQTVDQTLQQQFNLSRDSGALVVSVNAGSPAANAGLQQGDIIYKADSRDINTDSDLFGFLRGKKPGDTVLVSVDRNGQTVTARVTLAERPQ